MYLRGLAEVHIAYLYWMVDKWAQVGAARPGSRLGSGLLCIHTQILSVRLNRCVEVVEPYRIAPTYPTRLVSLVREAHYIC